MTATEPRYLIDTYLDFIQAEGLPPGKMSIFITIGIAAAICPRARPSQPDIDTLHRPPVSGASSGHFWRANLGHFSRVPKLGPRPSGLIRFPSPRMLKDLE